MATRLLLLLLLTFGPPILRALPKAPTPWTRHTIDQSSKGADGVRLLDVNRDGRADIATGWEEGGLIRLYLHPGPEQVRQPWPAVTVGRVPSVEDAFLVDLDGDGQTDLVSAAEGRAQTLSVHWAPAEGLLDSGQWRTAAFPMAAGKTRWMFAASSQIDRQYGLDLFVGSKNPDGQISWLRAPSQPTNLSRWSLHPLRPAGWIMSLIPHDMDGDGDEDLLFSDRKGGRSGCFWLEKPDRLEQLDQPWPEHPVGAIGLEVMFLTIADLDQDRFPDVIAAVRPKSILFLRRLTSDGRSWKSHPIEVPASAGNAKGIAAGDIDLDGDPDLVFSCEHGKDRSGVMWLAFKNTPFQRDWDAFDISGPEGTKFDLVQLVDLDEDGDLDVITCEEKENLGVIWYENPSR